VSLSAWKREAHYWPIRQLKQLARLPHEYATWLGDGHTVPNDDPPRPYARGTRLCCAIVLAPRVYGLDLPVLRSAGRRIQFFVVQHLHPAEVQLKLDHGADALLEALAKAGVDQVVRPDRPSAVR
jgi:hypothetical protein